MDKILEMRRKRAKLVEEARAILDKAEEEKRSLTAEEEQQYERIMADVDELAKKIQREERMQALEKEMNEFADKGLRMNPNEGPEEKREKGNLRATAEYRNAFWQAIKFGKNALDANQVRLLFDPEVRTLVIGDEAAGGYLVPDEFERTLIQKLEEENIMRGLATVITTASGTREIPVEADYGQAYWLGENEQYRESDASFGRVVLGAHKLGTIVKVSEELMYDSAFNMAAYVSSAFARRMGRAEEEAFIVGDGSGKPKGLVHDAQVGVTAPTGQTDSITADNLIDLYHALRRPYRSRATWLMSDSTAKALRKLKDNDGQYLWQPGLQAGQPDRILGRPVAISDFVPPLGAGNRSILFGDLSYYWIADRVGRVMQRLDELYAVNGQVGFRMYQRVDGRLVLPEAVVCFQNAAS